MVAQREDDDEAPAKATPPDEDARDGKRELPVVAEDNQEKSSPTDELVEKKKLVQRPVYFVSSLLQGARTRYSGMQKLLFGLLMASRKLRH